MNSLKDGQNAYMDRPLSRHPMVPNKLDQQRYVTGFQTLRVYIELCFKTLCYWFSNTHRISAPLCIYNFLWPIKHRAVIIHNLHFSLCLLSFSLFCSSYLIFILSPDDQRLYYPRLASQPRATR